MHKFRKVAGLLVALAVTYATDAWSQACDYSITSFTADKTVFDPKRGETVTFTATAEAPSNRYYSIFFSK